jgi:WD40 repeat protein
MHDGKSIISGWSDGKIRAFLPQSGKLLYAINDAHNHGCTAVTATSDGQRIISGGAEGEIRIWRITTQTQVMEASLKEHRSQVWSIEVNKDNSQAVSASGDGSCIIWDLKNHTRILCLFESTAFKEATLNPQEYQILTVGSDRRITYWEKFDGTTIRSVEGSNKEINTIAVTKEGKHFVTGGQDGLLKIWNYD